MPENSDIAAVIKKKIDRPLVMIGLMGAGKSRIGRLLAHELDLPFIDSDKEIENAAGCSISEIFERDGEQAFREAERKIIARLLDREPLVLATGGGAVMNPQTAELVWSKAISIWLRADVDLLFERTKNVPGRPLLSKGDPHETLSRLAETRYPVYEKADLVVDSLDVQYYVTLDTVMRNLYEHLCH